MSDDIKFAVYEKDETLADSIYKDSFSAAVVTFLVYISHDSTFWTFVTGSMFLLFVFGTVSNLMNRRSRFKTKKELQEWVDSLPDDEERR